MQKVEVAGVIFQNEKNDNPLSQKCKYQTIIIRTKAVKAIERQLIFQSFQVFMSERTLCDSTNKQINR